MTRTKANEIGLIYMAPAMAKLRNSAMTMWPASILAKSRIPSENGRMIKLLKPSRTNKTGMSGSGVPEGIQVLK